MLFRMSSLVSDHDYNNDVTVKLNVFYLDSVLHLRLLMLTWEYGLSRAIHRGFSFLSRPAVHVDLIYEEVSAKHGQKIVELLLLQFGKASVPL